MAEGRTRLTSIASGEAPTWDAAPGVVCIERPRIGRAFNPRDYVQWIGAGCGAIAAGLLLHIQMVWASGAAVVLVLPVAMAISWMSARTQRALVRSIQQQSPRDSWRDIAFHAWLLARTRSSWTRRPDPLGGLHEEIWFGSQPPGGSDQPRPRVILADVRPRIIPGGDELSETVEVGPSRRMTPQERRRRLKQLAWFTLAACMLSVPWFLGGSSTPYFWVIWFSGQVLIVVYRLGWGPILINSALASMGSLEITRWGARAEFTAEKAVLLVEPAPGASPGDATNAKANIRVHAIRRDGRKMYPTFDNIADPGLSDLLARWLGVPMPVESPASEAGDAFPRNL